MTSASASSEWGFGRGLCITVRVIGPYTVSAGQHRVGEKFIMEKKTFEEDLNGYI